MIDIAFGFLSPSVKCLEKMDMAKQIQVVWNRLFPHHLYPLPDMAKQIQVVWNATPKKKQVMMFTATMTEQMGKLSCHEHRARRELEHPQQR